MDAINAEEEKRDVKLCHEALGVYPDCVDGRKSPTGSRSGRRGLRTLKLSALAVDRGGG